MTARNTFLENKYLIQNTSIGVDKMTVARKKIGRLSSPHLVIIRPRKRQLGLQRGARENVHPYEALSVNLDAKELNTETACFDKYQLKQETFNLPKGETKIHNRDALATENILARKSPAQWLVSGNNRPEPGIKFSGSGQKDNALKETIVGLASFTTTKEDAEKSQVERRRSSSVCLDDEATTGTCSAVRHRKQRRHSYV